MSGGVEVERTYEVPSPRAVLPALDDVPGVASVQRLSDEDLSATYYDTADLRLARTSATLRRRTGGRDAGWHLKLPAPGSGRYELTAPLRATRPPAALVRLVRSRSRGAALVPVVRLVSRREVLQLRGDGGQVLAEVADDHVTVEPLDGGPVAAGWREVEVELVDGGEALLDAVERRLSVWGARPASSTSKLRRALGERLAAAPTVLGSTAGDVVLAHLREQVAELVLRDPSVRRDEDDAVHKMRVATRRLRSALQTFRPLLDREVTDPLRGELSHLAGVLGGARDAEVLRDRLLAQLREQPAELGAVAAAEHVAARLGERYAAAHAAVVAELDGTRYVRLLDALDELVSAPLLGRRATRSAAKELPRLVARSHRRLADAHDAATAASGAEQDELLHEVRKSAKRARYAAEAVARTVGADATRYAAAAERVQEVLGERQDSAVTREALVELAHGAGDAAFALGRLHGLEDGRSRQAGDEYADAWTALTRKKVVGWLG